MQACGKAVTCLASSPRFYLLTFHLHAMLSGRQLTGCSREPYPAASASLRHHGMVQWYIYSCESMAEPGSGVQAYEHASQLVAVYAEVPMGVEVLVQIDRLVQLLETPAFTFLRLQLLQPARHPALIRWPPSSCHSLLWPHSRRCNILHSLLSAAQPAGISTRQLCSCWMERWVLA